MTQEILHQYIKNIVYKMVQKKYLIVNLKKIHINIIKNVRNLRIIYAYPTSLKIIISRNIKRRLRERLDKRRGILILNSISSSKMQ